MCFYRGEFPFWENIRIGSFLLDHRMQRLENRPSKIYYIHPYSLVEGKFEISTNRPSFSASRKVQTWMALSEHGGLSAPDKSKQGLVSLITSMVRLSHPSQEIDDRKGSGSSDNDLQAH